MKILITGGTGFLGSHIVNRFVSQGHQVIVLKRRTSDLKRIQSVLSLVSTYDIEGLDLSRPFKDNGKIDVIIHAGTCYGRNNESASDIFEANMVFPLRLLETAAFFNTATFFNADTVLNRDLNFYALSKSQFTEWGKQFSGAGKIRFVNIRLEHMYGPGDDDSKFTSHVIKSCLANVSELNFTAGEQKRDFIYIDDVAAAYATLLQVVDHQPGFFQEYDLGSGKPVSIRSFVETVHQITQSRTRLNFGALPYRENEIMHSFADIESLEVLGWRCRTDLVQGIEAVVKEERSK